MTSKLQLGELAADLIRELQVELERRGSSRVAQGRLGAGIEPQVRSILAETVLKLHADLDVADLVSFDYSNDDAFLEKGAVSAKHDYDPSEPLVVGELTFGLALPRLVELFADDDAMRIAQHLHHAIWRRFPPGAIAYVQVLREQLEQAEALASKRLARELHDRIAHGILAGIQQIELGIAGASGPHLESARAGLEQLRSTLADTRALARDVRLELAGASLDEAIASYVERSLGDAPPVRHGSTGAPSGLTERVTAELFAIVVEAIRNARAHAVDATVIEVTTQWRVDRLTVRIADDGPGGATADSGSGTRGMGERAAAIGAEFTLEASHEGSAVIVELPFSGNVAP